MSQEHRPEDEASPIVADRAHERLHAELRAARAELRAARDELRAARDECGALRDRSRRYVAAVPGGYAELDSTGRVLMANDTLLGMLGAEGSAGNGLADALLAALEPSETLPAHLGQAEREGTARFRGRLRRADRPAIEAEISLASLPAENCFAAFVRDLSEQAAALADLAASRDRFAKAFHLSPDAININRLADGCYLEINEGFTQITGYTAEEVIGRCSTPGDLGIWVHASDRDRLVAGLRERGEVVGLEAPFRRKDGSVAIGLMSARLIEIDGERCILSITRDNSERHATRQAIIAEKERLRVTLSSIGDGVVATDREGRVTLLNPVAEDLLGLTEAEAMGRPVEQVMGALAPAAQAGPGFAGSLLASPEGGGRQVSLPNADGTARLVAERAAPIRAEGEVVGVVLALRDITAEQRLRDDLQRIAKLESLGVLAGGIAHDFNNLLTAVVGHAEMARADLLPETGPANPALAAEHLRDVELAAMRARGLTQQLLTFAKGGAPVRETVPVAPLVQEASHFALSGSNCLCQEHLPDDLWPAHADGGQVQQVLHNLLINAAQAMPDGGTIIVAAANVPAEEASLLPVSVRRHVRLTVADNGVGIAPEQLGRIFDPFYTTKPQGNGLGLASVHSIVRAHGGHVAVCSEPGVGSRFDIYLPASDEAADTRPVGSEPRAAATPWRILVLDDEPSIARLLKRMLEMGGHRVVTVPDGRAALDAWRQAEQNGEPFDLAILDLTVPGGLGGVEVVRQWRREGVSALAVASSGYATGAVMADCHEHGFVDRLVKPYRRDDVTALIARLQLGSV